MAGRNFRHVWCSPFKLGNKLLINSKDGTVDSAF